MRRSVLYGSAVVVAAGIAFAAPQVTRHLTGAHMASTAIIAPAVRASAAASAPSASAHSLTGAATVTPPSTAPAAPLLSSHPVSIKDTVFFGYSLLDRTTGEITGSANREQGTNSTESMIKAWIASDYLRRLAAEGRAPSATDLRELTLMIIHSDDNIAQHYYAIDGKNAVVGRLIAMCGLTHTTIFNAWWSKTRMTPADAVRYGKCLADGVAAGKKWTPWILNTMTHVVGGVNDQQATTGGGRWGIITALPAGVAATTSIKNGWTSYDGVWHVNCMAIQKDWVLTVMMRYPSGDGLKFGAAVCTSVAQQLMNGTDTTQGGALPSES